MPPVVQIPATSYKLPSKQDWTFILFYFIQTSGCSDHHDPESSAYHLFVLEYFTWLLSCMFPFCATLHFFSTTFSDFFFTSHCLFVTFPPSCMLQICIKTNCLWFVEHFWYLNRMFRWPDAEFVPLTARPRERWGWKWASFLLCFQEKLTFKGVFFFSLSSTLSLAAVVGCRGNLTRADPAVFLPGPAGTEPTYLPPRRGHWRRGGGRFNWHKRWCRTRWTCWSSFHLMCVCVRPAALIIYWRRPLTWGPSDRPAHTCPVQISPLKTNKKPSHHHELHVFCSHSLTTLINNKWEPTFHKTTEENVCRNKEVIVP